MNIGIIGSEAAKFTPTTEAVARDVIRTLLKTGDELNTGVSGGCHLGGIDSWVKEEGDLLHLPVIEFFPKTHDWATGYKPRNILIAKNSLQVHCITVQVLPPGYTGMRFKTCYHCQTSTHVKSGGCWTVKYAKEVLKKVGLIHVISPGGVVTTTGFGLSTKRHTRYNVTGSNI